MPIAFCCVVDEFQRLRIARDTTLVVKSYPVGLGKSWQVLAPADISSVHLRIFSRFAQSLLTIHKLTCSFKIIYYIVSVNTQNHCHN